MKGSTSRTVATTRDAIEDHLANIHGVLCLMVILFGGEIAEDDRPEDAQLHGLFYFLNEEAQAIPLEVDEHHESYFPPAFWDAAKALTALTNIIELVIRTNGVAMPFHDREMDELVAAMKRAGAMTKASLLEVDSRLASDLAAYLHSDPSAAPRKRSAQRRLRTPEVTA